MSEAKRLEEVVLTDLEGKERVLSSLWAEQPIVLAFVRHFG